MIELVWPWLLLLLPAPLLVSYLLPPARDGRAGALLVPFFDAIRAFHEERVSAPYSVPFAWLVAAAWIMLVVAAARPQWIDPPEAVPATGRDLLLAVDLSASMHEMDFSIGGLRASRLDVLKQVAGEFIERRVGDRVGLIVFGSHAYLYAPLTRDRDAVRALLEEAEVGLAGDYTAIGDAIGLGAGVLMERPARSRVLILLTDGANTAGAITPRQGIDLARTAAVRVHAVGIGPIDDTPLPNPLGTWQQAVVEGIDQALLQEIGESTGGVYLHALDTDGMAAAWEMLDRLEPSLYGHIDYLYARSLYHLPLAAALMIAAWLAARGILRRGRG